MGLLSAITPIGAGISLAGQVYSAFKGAQGNRANQRLINQQKEENKAFYNNNANKDFLQTNVAKDVTKEMQSNLEDNRKAVAGRGAITGASDEAIVAGNAEANNTYQNGLSRLAGIGTQYQNQQEDKYRQQNNSLNAMQMDLNKEKSKSASNLGANAGDLAGSIGSLAGM